LVVRLRARKIPLAGVRTVITGLVVPWVLTVVFAVSAVLYGAQVRTAPAWQSRVAWSLHVLMALAMIAMAWPWGMGVPTIVYGVVFTACALYFAYLGVFHAGVGHAFYHSAMMASMVLMAVAMSSPIMSSSTTPDTSGTGSMGAMPGMNMAGTGSTTVGSSAAPMWVTVTCGAAAVLFLGAALWSFFVLVRGPQRPYANLLMTAGMGVAFTALAV
jgi:Domain of unknown function (DUF5134)